jgi:hypothetical protein
MLLSKEALRMLLPTRMVLIEQADYSIPGWVNAVELQTVEGMEEHAVWSAYIMEVTDGIEGKKIIPT